MDVRRLLLAAFLSILVWNLYQNILHPPRPKTTVNQAPEQAVKETAAKTEGIVQPTPAEPSESLEAPARVLISDEKEKRIEIETPDVVISFTNRGARLVSWRLKRYRDDRDRPTELLQIDPAGPRALDVETGRDEIDSRLREVLFRPVEERVKIDAHEKARLRFEYVDTTIRAEKQIELAGDSYLVRVQAAVQQGERALPLSLYWGPGLAGDMDRARGMGGAAEPQAVVYSGGKVARYEAKKLRNGPRSITNWAWAGLESAYFASVFVDPENNGSCEVFSANIGAEGEKQQLAPGMRLFLNAPDSTVALYVGPKDYHILARYGHDLRKIVPVGDWIGPIVVPLLALLRWAHSHVGNYGWAIVALTLLINLVMAPLRHFGFINSAKMAKLAPEMRAIQDRYRKYSAFDPKRQEMQTELAALYARHGMSMQGQMLVGCLPLLLTMPFLFAFYRVLQVSIDLRGAPFLWIPDLSQKDPIFITPILMGVSMLVMQSMTPSTVDATQRRMMMIMPLVLVVMFFMAPAGLNLYWLSSNLCAIVQQLVTYHFLRRGAANRRTGRQR